MKKELNKRTLIGRAKRLLADWEATEELKRHYDNINWHTVNVKRHGDSLELDDLIKNYPKKWQERLKDEFNDEAVGDLYYQFLSDSWDLLNNDISESDKELEFIELQGEIRKEDYKTRCNKCYRKTWYEKEQKCHCEGCNGRLKKIKYKQEWDERKYVYSLGISGGWACFQDLLDDVEGDLQSIIDWDIEDFDYYAEEEDRRIAVKEVLDNVEQCIDEIDWLKNCIEDFNNGLDFEAELRHRIDEVVDYENDKIDNKEHLLDEASKLTTTATATILNYTTNKKIKDSIARNFGSIKATIKKELS